jgi:DNA-binding MarR family transcriptional regulator
MTMSNNNEVISAGMLPGGNRDRTKEVVWLIRRLMQGSSLYNKELNKKYQVSAPQLSSLLALYENGPMPPSQIAKYIMVNSSTVTGIIDRLEQKGLVERSRISPDRRVITIALTEKGEELAKNAPPPIQKKIVDGLKKLPPDETEQIVQALSKLTYMLDVQDLEVDEIS